MNGPHKQVWAKVNAPVDEGVAALVEALSAFPQLRTRESCESVDGKGTAWVCFTYGEDGPEDWRALAEFVLGYLAPGLMRDLGDLVNIRINVTNFTIGELSVRPGVMPRALKALRRLRRRFGS
jgi:hypothetical protein